MNEDEAVIVREMRGDALWLRINRPTARNAINDLVIEGLWRGLDEALAAGAKVVVVTGTGDRAFCAGGDLKPGATSFQFDHSRNGTAYANLFRRVVNFDLPLVARVNGACMAGGMGLMAMCDMVVAADTAIFGLPEVKVGLFPMQVASVLQHLMPARLFREMCLTGEPIGAARAQAADLVNYVVPAAELDQKTGWLIERLADKSPTAIRRGRYALAAIADMTFEQSISFTEAQVGPLLLTEDAQEGFAAFNEKRPPRWTGR